MLQLLCQFAHAKHLQHRDGEFDGKRQAIELADNFRYGGNTVLVDFEPICAEMRSAIQEQLNGRIRFGFGRSSWSYERVRERRQVEGKLAGNPQAFATRREQADSGARCGNRDGNLRDALEKVFAVVQHDKRASVFKRALQEFGERTIGPFACSDGVDDRERNELRIGNAGEGYDVSAVLKAVDDSPGRFEGETALPDATRPRDRDQALFVPKDEATKSYDFVRAANEAGDRLGKLVGNIATEPCTAGVRSGLEFGAFRVRKVQGLHEKSDGFATRSMTKATLE
jgi:hypothetical protein